MFVKRFSLFLAPSIVTMAVSFVMVPVTTYVIGPEGYGTFALMNSLVAIGWTLAVIGSSAVCNAHFMSLDRNERVHMVSTILYVALALAAAFCLVFIAAWPLAVRYLDGYATVPYGAVALTLAAVVMGVPWMVAQDVITLDGKARGFAATTIAQTLVAASVTTLGLYVWELGVMALFLSTAAGAAVTLCGATFVLRPYLSARFSRRWASAIWQVGPASATLNVMEAFQTNVERGFLASTLGVAPLGLYVHAQNYRIIVAQVLKAAARPIWPITLAEAAEPESMFRRTRTVWDAMYLTVTAAGVTFALLGGHVIGWLTHGRFTAAQDVATFLMILLLVQNAGKPQMGQLYRAAALREYYWIQVAAIVAWFGSLILLVRAAGLVGGVLALIAQQTMCRVGVQLLARRQGASPMADAWVFKGAAVIVAAWLVGARLDTLGAELAVWAVLMTALLLAGARTVQRFLESRRATLSPNAADVLGGTLAPASDGGR